MRTAQINVLILLNKIYKQRFKSSSQYSIVLGSLLEYLQLLYISVDCSEHTKCAFLVGKLLLLREAILIKILLIKCFFQILSLFVKPCINLNLTITHETALYTTLRLGD